MHFNVGTVWNSAQVHVTPALPMRKMPPVSIRRASA